MWRERGGLPPVVVKNPTKPPWLAEFTKGRESIATPLSADHFEALLASVRLTKKGLVVPELTFGTAYRINTRRDEITEEQILILIEEARLLANKIFEDSRVGDVRFEAPKLSFRSIEDEKLRSFVLFCNERHNFQGFTVRSLFNFDLQKGLIKPNKKEEDKEKLVMFDDIPPNQMIAIRVKLQLLDDRPRDTQYETRVQNLSWVLKEIKSRDESGILPWKANKITDDYNKFVDQRMAKILGARLMEEVIPINDALLMTDLKDKPKALEILRRINFFTRYHGLTLEEVFGLEK